MTESWRDELLTYFGEVLGVRSVFLPETSRDIADQPMVKPTETSLSMEMEIEDLSQSRLLFLSMRVSSSSLLHDEKAYTLFENMRKAMGLTQEEAPVIELDRDELSKITNPLSVLVRNLNLNKALHFVCFSEQLEKLLGSQSGGKIFSTFDPRTLLKQPAKKKKAWSDLQAVLREMHKYE